ncbi:zinc finger CCCH domain-containing protein 18 isoform X2 [Halyomorpha halys]|uniref:zinc finger CCCH domain-containing protein 18 isoform X2 n=1 Tax=Halyomorpha halys TaxID=286706 RepID=UPI0006D4ECCA|nr:serine/arginine repetitive matrix protein 1-like isoform X2 [Halyomorpha halys]
MDSDSSQDGDDRHNGCRRRDWENRQNSDVSDDENFSRGAKSIDSPPESPPRGGGNLDSPPASPAQGVESPHSVYSGSRSGGSSAEGTPDYPQSPDSPPPKSPATPERADSRSRLTERDDSNSPGRGNSRIGDREESVSPVPGSGHSGVRNDSPSPSRGNSQGSYRDRSESPDEGDDRARGRDVSMSPERDNRHSTERDDSQSPERRSRHSSGRDRSVSPGTREYSRNPGSKTGESVDRYGKRSFSQSPNGTYSSLRNTRFASPENSDSPRRVYHEKDSHRSSAMNRNRSQSPDIKYSSSPTRQDTRDKKSKGNKSKSPDGHTTSYRNENSQDWPASPPTLDSTSNKGSPNRNKIASPCSIGSSSPVAKKSKYDTRDNSPDSHAQSISSRDSSPGDVERNFHNIRNHVRNKSSIERSNLSSPDRSLKKGRLHKDNARSKHNREKHKNPNYKRVSPKRHSDSDGRSNISSDSSIGSPSPKSRSPEPKRSNKTDKVEIKSHGEDLSDVSDIESIGSDEEQKAKEVKKIEKEKEEKEKKNGINLEEAEQLDFEAEESDSPSKKKDKDAETEEGEVKELEEGELSDEGEVRPEETEPRPVCRFFSRGQCTWGSSCSFRHPEALLPPIRPRFPRPFLSIRGRGHHFPFRTFNPRFVHPGVTDKGNYTMFDMVRPLVPMNTGPPPPHIYPPIDCYRPPIERPPIMGPPPYQQPAAVLRREEPPGESAWERGLRQAKEMLRRSTKRKETDADFEEKKMTLGISGQEEYDKENDYYPRPSSPVYDDYHERSKEGEKRYRSVSDRFGDYPPPSGYYREGWYDDRSRYHHSSRHHSSSGYGSRTVPEDYYESRKKKYSSREVVVQRGEKGSWKENSPPSVRSRSGRGDEWSDPWMRSKSPSRKGASRKKSYSSRSRSSSYSSSSSRSSSSYSSYSHSRSQSSISRSGSSRSRSRSSFSRKKLSPLSRRAKSPFSRERRVGEGDRGLHMNPPPPSPRGTSPRRNPTPPPQAERNSRNISARLLAAAMRDRSVSSRSSSGSESSGSSSDSSSDSGSSSSSSSSTRRKHNRKKIELDEKLAQAVKAKAKAMDALKLSGQKQQIKLTLKGTGSSISERLAAPLTRKRPAPDSPNSGEDDSSPNVAKKKSAPSRREELLKQLKAVEDAIARKRSKI